jgi:hypothetical protein
MTRYVYAIGALLLTFAVPAPATADERRWPARVAIDERLDGPPVLANALGTRSIDFPVIARIIVSPTSDEASTLRRLDERVRRYEQRQTPIWIALGDWPASLESAEAFRVRLARLAARYRGRVHAVELTVPEGEARLTAYVVKLAATALHAEDSRLKVVIGVGALRTVSLEGLFKEGLAAYIDGVAIPAGRAGPAGAIVARSDPTAALVETGATLSDDRADEARSRIVEGELPVIGSEVSGRSYAGSAAQVAAALAGAAGIAPLLAGEVALLDPRSSSLRLSVDGRDVTSTLRHRLLYDVQTFATYLVYWDERTSSDVPRPATPDGKPGQLALALRLPIEGLPVVVDAIRGTRRPAETYARDAASQEVRAVVPLTGRPMVVDFNEGAAEIFAARDEVRADDLPSVEEIIARHQRQQAAQDLRVRSYVANVRMSQHFRPTVTDPGYDVVTENHYFADRDGVEWAELSFSVNGSRWGADRPAFPILQAEKVLSLPLNLRFDADYRYRLLGVERVRDAECYAVRFEPARNGRSLYRGTVWLDRRTFARVKVQAVQTELTAPVVSNEEIQTFAPVTTIEGEPAVLFTHLTSRQIVLIAGRNLLVEKTVAFSDFRVNPDDFDGERQAARASNRVMYRETDRGLRHYVKQGERRVVSDRPTLSAKAMAMGVTLDPSFGFPLPIFGINYLDFEFGGPDTQLALLFGGVLAAGNIQRPKLGASPFDASVDFFAIGVPASDRMFGPSGEVEAERVLTWPLSAGVNLGYQYTPFQKASLQYQFRFDGYTRDQTTSDSFNLPSSTTTHGVGGSYEFRRAGYSLVANGAWFGRSSWSEWGPPESSAEQPQPERTYEKYSASITRDFYFKLFHKVHLNGAWFGGRRLDRFSKYQFGLFDDTRIHGVPASGLRFDELAMVRGSYSFNIFDHYRLDLFLEQASGRDRDLSSEWQPITGLGVAVNLRAPWNTILRADFGKSLLPDGYRGIGSTVLQILLLKPM